MIVSFLGYYFFDPRGPNKVGYLICHQTKRREPYGISKHFLNLVFR